MFIRYFWHHFALFTFNAVSSLPLRKLFLPVNVFIFHRNRLFLHLCVLAFYRYRFLFSLVLVSVFWNIVLLNVLSHWMWEVGRFVLGGGECFWVLRSFGLFIVVAFIVLLLQKFNFFTKLIVSEFCLFVPLIKRQQLFILRAAEITLIDQDLQFMRILIFNIKSFEVFFPFLDKIGNGLNICRQFFFTYWQSGDFLFGFKYFVLELVQFKIWSFFFIFGKVEPELTFGRDIRSHIATTGAVVLINEFHESLVSLLVHYKILFHFFLDFVQDDIFWKYKVFLFHVFIYF